MPVPCIWLPGRISTYDGVGSPVVKARVGAHLGSQPPCSSDCPASRLTGKLGTMSVLSVETAGLQSLGGVCTSKSAAIAAKAATAATPATSFQPSAAAASAVRTEAGLAGATLSGRLTATSAHLSGAATGYTTREAGSAAVLAELPVTV